MTLVTDTIHVGIDYLCKDARCPKWRTCYRFRAIPNAKSRYFERSPREIMKRIGPCDYFMEFSSNTPVLTEADLKGL